MYKNKHVRMRMEWEYRKSKKASKNKHVIHFAFNMPFNWGWLHERPNQVLMATTSTVNFFALKW